MKKAIPSIQKWSGFILVVGVVVFALLTQEPNNTPAPIPDRSQSLSAQKVPPPALVADADQIRQAFRDNDSNIIVSAHGSVVRILPDDLDGSRHQKFILRLNNDLTVLISHNIDLAPRIKGLKKNDRVEFFGEYEWNERGGIVHWTHHDPNGMHPGGWLKHNGQIYE